MASVRYGVACRAALTFGSSELAASSQRKASHRFEASPPKREPSEAPKDCRDQGSSPLAPGPQTGASCASRSPRNLHHPCGWVPRVAGLFHALLGRIEGVSGRSRYLKDVRTCRVFPGVGVFQVVRAATHFLRRRGRPG